MAFNWEHVEAIRAENSAARERFNQNVVSGTRMTDCINDSPGSAETKLPWLDEWDVKLQKLQTQLIDYIIEHGLVQGFDFDGVSQPIKGGKIAITADMIKMVTDRFGYFTEKETNTFIEKYLPEHHYVSDEKYVHTDNNYTAGEKKKLAGIEEGAQVNAILDVIFNGSTVLDPETKIATITITPEQVREWYEQNANTNAFTDSDKAKLDGIAEGAEVNKVNDVTLDGVTVIEEKIAKLTKEKIKASYESNDDTNAFTNAEKQKLSDIAENAEVNKVNDVKVNGRTVVVNKVADITAADIKTAYESNENTNAFTDADKKLVEETVPEIDKQVNDHEKRIDPLEQFQTEQVAKNKELDAKDEEQDEKIAAINAKDAGQDKRLDAVETKDTAQDKRLDTIEAKDTAQDKRLDTTEAKDTAQDERLDAIEAKDTVQDEEITEAKNSISELGDEVNAVGGRVTTNEAAIAELKKSQTAQDEDISQLQEDVNNINKKSTEQDGEISNLQESITAINAKTSSQDEETSNLKNSITSISEKNTTQDEEIANLKESVANAGKVDDVKVGGVSVVTNKIANIPAIPDTSEFVPYTGAVKDVNLNGHGISSSGQDPSDDRKVSMSSKSGFLASDTEYVAQAGTACARIGGSSINFSNTQSDSISTLDTTTLQIVRSQNSKVYAAALNINSLIFTNPDKAGGIVRGLDAPTDDTDATNKKYVDEKLSSVDTSNCVPYMGATKNVILGDHELSAAKGSADASATFFSGDSVYHQYKESSSSETPSMLYYGIDDYGLYVRKERTISGDASNSFSVNGYITTRDFTSANTAEDGLAVVKKSTDGTLELANIKAAAPAEGTDVATKEYVDTTISGGMPQFYVGNFIFPAGFNIPAESVMAVGFNELVPTAWGMITSKKPKGKSIRIGGCISSERYLNDEIKILGMRVGLTSGGDDFPILDIENTTGDKVSLTGSVVIGFNMIYGYE